MLEKHKLSSLLGFQFLIQSKPKRGRCKHVFQAIAGEKTVFCRAPSRRATFVMSLPL